MDSIGDNVMAIICVVVGILIIGCALVPIVDNASVITTEETTTEHTSGFNELLSPMPSGYSKYWLQPVSEYTLSTDGDGYTVNGESYTDASTVLYFYQTIGGSNLAMTNVAHEIVVKASFDSTAPRLATGSVTFSDGILTISGTTTDSTSYSKSVETGTLYVTAIGGIVTSDPKEAYGFVGTGAVIGEGQKLIKSNGSAEVTPDSTEMPEGVTIVANDDGTATVTIESGYWFGPYKWTGSITTTETTTTDSEYKDLYNIIPVLCILGMAYVLIRRFY